MNRKLIFIAIFLIMLGLGFTTYTGYFAATEYREPVDVSRVIDGDTLELEDGRQVRLLGINTPEVNEFLYKEATDYLKQLLADKQIALESFGQDKYGRTLGYVYADDELVNLGMIKAGLAHKYLFSDDDKFYKEFRDAEEVAKEKQLGIWKSEKRPCISIVRLNYNAEGNDNKNLNDEYVTFRNVCAYPVDMSGWELKDEGTHIYRIKSLTLTSNSEITIYSGSGKNYDSNLYWNSRRSIWNNDKDTLFLRDKNGTLVLTFSYPY